MKTFLKLLMGFPPQSSLKQTHSLNGYWIISHSSPFSYITLDMFVLIFKPIR